MKKLGFLISILLISAFSLSAYDDSEDEGAGCGGIFFQRQATEYPFAEDWNINQASMDLEMIGGSGYGVSSDGKISGGFGFGILSDLNDDGILEAGEVAGGFGGIINGVRILRYPLNLSFITCIGLGGVAQGNGVEDEEDGWFSVILQANVEVGLPAFGWFMPVVYAGYQYMGSLIDNEAGESFQTYSPVLGARLFFGCF